MSLLLSCVVFFRLNLIRSCFSVRLPTLRGIFIFFAYYLCGAYKRTCVDIEIRRNNLLFFTYGEGVCVTQVYNDFHFTNPHMHNLRGVEKKNWSIFEFLLQYL